VAAVCLDEITRLGEILFCVTIRIGHDDLPNESDWRFRLGVKLLNGGAAQNSARQHCQ
jgi:hypothetical protein